MARIAEQEGLSVSATGAAYLTTALQQNLYTQQAATIAEVIQKHMGIAMRSFGNRFAVLLVRNAYASEQTRSIVTNILNRQPGMSQAMIQDILLKSSNAAKSNITRKTPQLQIILEEVEHWFHEGGGTE